MTYNVYGELDLLHFQSIGKEETTMATSTFERKIEITEPESIKKLIAIMTKETPSKPLSKHPYSEADRERSERLLKQCLSRSRR